MPSTRDIKRILTGGNDVKRVMYRDTQVWPTAFTAVLEVVWVFGGQYSINAIPAGGGTATATWTLSIYRESDRQLVDSIPVVPNNVTISDTTNFSYDVAKGVWRANDRERNGISSASGTTVPSSAPARSCSLHAAVQYTYHGVNVSASYDTTMMQNANNYTPGTSYYTNLRVALDRYNSSTSPAPAYESTATISASLDQHTPGTFSSGSAYTYVQPNAVGSNRFSFTESASWLTVSGTTVTVAGRGTDDGASRDASILATFTGDTSIRSSVTLYQRDNRKVEISRAYTFYEIALSDTYHGYGRDAIEVPQGGGYVYLVGKAWYDIVYRWPSGAPNTTGEDSKNADPTRIYAEPSSGVTMDTANARVSLPANSAVQPKEYEIWGEYTEGGVTRSASRHSATVAGLAYEYGTPLVSLDYDLAADDYHIAAAGGSAVPYLSFSQPIIQGGTVVGYVRGSLSNGATSGTADDGTPFSVSFSGTGANGGSVAAGGTVSIGSRRTYTGNKRNAATNIKAVVVCHGVRGESDTVSAVTQQENRAIPFNAYDEYYSATIKNLRNGSASGTIIKSISSAAPTTVYVEFVASWGHYDAGVEYTSGERTGGDYTYHNNEPVTPYFLQVVGSSGGYNTNTFTASNQYNDSGAKKYTITAWFAASDGPSDSVSIYQSADRKVSATRNYTASLSVSSNTVSASGGYATLVASAGHEEYKYWASDNQEISGSSSQKADGVTIVRRSGGTRFTLSGATVTHQNMAKNQTTDTVVYYARNDSQTNAISSDVSLSATNTRSSTPREAGDWHDVGGKSYGTPTYVDQNYAVTLSANAYTSSSNAAPFKGGTYPSLLTFTGSFDRVTTTPWTQGQEGTLYYDYTSGAYDEVTGTRTVSGSDVSTVQKNGTPTFSSNQSWLSVAASGVVTIAESSSTSVRNATITATLGNSSKSVTIYQRRFASISISVDSIIFTKQSGTATFVVSYTNTTFSVSHNGQGDPVTGLSPTSGGSATSSGTRTVTVTVGANSGSSNRIGEIVVDPGDAELDNLLIDVLQEGTPAAGTYVGFPMVEWATSSRINYDCLVTNNSSSAKTITATLQVVYTTGDQHPSSGSSISTKTVTGSVDSGATSSIGNGTIYATKYSSRKYWCRLSCELFDSGWQQIEEPAS